MIGIMGVGFIAETTIPIKASISATIILIITLVADQEYEAGDFQNILISSDKKY